MGPVSEKGYVPSCRCGVAVLAIFFGVLCAFNGADAICPLVVPPPCNQGCGTCGAQPTRLDQSGKRNEIASFWPGESGLYTLQLVRVSDCGVVTKAVTVQATCDAAQPEARIVAPDPLTACHEDWFVNERIEVAGWGTGKNLTTCWCLLTKPSESAASLEAEYGVVKSLNNVTGMDLSARTAFTPDLPGRYGVQFTLSNGCSRKPSVIYFDVKCRCAPTAVAGTIMTASFPRNSLVPVTTGTVGLDASQSYMPLSLSNGLLYWWSVVSTSTGYRVVPQPSIGTPSVTYEMRAPAPTPHPSVRVLNTTDVSNSTFMNSSEYIGIQGTLWDPRLSFAGPSTSLFYKRTLHTRVVVTEQVFVETSYAPSSHSFCNVTIANTTDKETTISAVPFTACRGTYGLKVEVSNGARATNGCGLSSDWMPWSVQCPPPPYAELQCAQWAEFNYTTKTFANVIIDGRLSANATGLAFTWKAEARPSTVIGASSGAGGGTVQAVGPLSDRVASFMPTSAGLTVVSLTIGDGCSTGTAEVNVVATCSHSTPMLESKVAVASNQWVRNVFVHPIAFELAAIVYDGNTADVAVWWSILDPMSAVIGSGSFTADMLPMNVSATARRDGVFTLMTSVTDGCRTANATLRSPPLSCSADQAAVTSYLVIPSPGCTWDAATLKFSVGIGADVSGPHALNWTWTQTRGSMLTDLMPSLSGNQSLFPPSDGEYDVTLSVTDGCTTATSSVRFVCYCPTIPTPEHLPNLLENIDARWDSNTSKYEEAFLKFPQNPFIQADAATYFQVKIVSQPNGGDGALQGSTLSSSALDNVTFVASVPGLYVVKYSLGNNCTRWGTSFGNVTYNVDVKCRPWSASQLTMMSTVDFVTGSMSFPPVCATLEFGMDLDTAHPKANFTFELISSPMGSVYGGPLMNGGQVSEVVGAATTIAANTTTWTTWNVSTTVWKKRVTTRVYENYDVLLLPVHKTPLGRVQVCFLPDRAGVYSVRARAWDECNAVDYSARSTTAICTSTVDAQFVPNQPVVIFNGKHFEPDAIAGRPLQVAVNLVEPSKATRLEYKWRLVSAPCSSVLTTSERRGTWPNNVTNALAHNQLGSVVSITFDIPGPYKIEITVLDPVCNSEPQVINATVTALPDIHLCEQELLLCRTLNPVASQNLGLRGIQPEVCLNATECPPAAPTPLELTNSSRYYTEKPLIFQPEVNVSVPLQFNGSFVAEAAMINGDDVTFPKLCEHPARYSWMLVQQCRHMITPPHVHVAPPLGNCTPAQSFTWHAVEVPCRSSMFAALNASSTVPSERSLLLGTTSTPKYEFKADEPGIYKLRLTVADGCSTASSDFTVTSRCVSRHHIVPVQSDYVVNGTCKPMQPIMMNVWSTYNHSDPIDLSALTPCPVKPVNTAIQPCPRKVCVCNLNRCLTTLQGGGCKCGQCECSLDPTGTTNGGSTTFVTNDPTGTMPPPVTPPPGTPPHAFTTRPGTPVQTTRLPATTVAATTLTTTTVPETTVAETTVAETTVATTIEETTVPATTVADTTLDDDNNADSEAEYEAALADAKKAHDKYIAAVWGGTMGPLGAGLVGSVAGNVVSVFNMQAMSYSQFQSAPPGLELMMSEMC